LIRDPRGSFETWVEEYGDPFLVQALNGPVVMTGRAELIRQIYGEDPETFLPFAVPTVLPILGGGSLLMMGGSEHRRERKLVMPMFHGERMRAYGDVIQSAARSQLESRGTTTWNALDLATSISLEVIVRAIFGAEQSQRTSELLAISREAVAKSNPLLFFSKRMQFSFLGISPWDRFRKIKRRLNDALDQELDARGREGRGEDILSLLVNARYDDGTAITREHLRDELFTFLFAGHETTALAITWAFYHLHRHPSVLDRLRQELDKGTDGSPATLTQLPYLKGIVQETLRLNPIVTEVVRLLAKPLQLGDYLLPAGLAVAPVAALAHYNPTTYPEPDQFCPERFLERSFSPFEFLPFGGGHRRCVGAAFATYELAIVIGTLFREFQFEMLENKVVGPKRRNVTVGPSSAIPMRTLERRV
jgi:cytochrome P450